MMALLRMLRRFWRTAAGHAAIEFALIVPIVLLLLVAVYDLGTGFTEKIKVQSALNSGMQHVMQTEGTDLAMTTTVINHQLDDKAGAASVSVEKICRCNSQAIACSQSCYKGVAHYVLASASLPYASPLMGVDMSVSANFELFVGYK
ncbi:pilus assembly protein [Devosia sp. WQ 349]|uniref:TadE/TadG family type IV pilus assembly protein n=1 Tax=Devosia sp. WQ 349K1 TaxID=2800329 RepID=UPI001903B781|nr:TadE/TadG family type IV pilus assembly protein [Devosia sp. WQ 349K1]MBK1794909.1 pilus assembly protein [Devosia sp. WQ 349K1]